MFSSRVMLLWLEVRDLALRNVPESSRSDVINRVTSTSLQVHEHFAIALAQPDRHDHFQQRAIDAFADLGAHVLRLAPGESHDELTLELTRLMERLSVAYHEPPPDQLRH